MTTRKTMLISTLGAAALAVAIGYGAGRARASGIPSAAPLTYSGTLANNGQPISGPHSITVKLWTDAASTAPADQACVTAPSQQTPVTSGHFAVVLDPTCVAAIHANSELWSEVVVDGTSLGRSKVGAVPFAVEADTASNAAGNLKDQLATMIPVGTVLAYAGPANGAPPPGWLFCDGSAVSRTTYANLHAAIGDAHGNGDGITTFNLPDYRGRFLRGTNLGAGRDPDAASRAAMNPNGNTGDAVGTVETASFESHSHAVNDPGHSHRQYVTANPGSCPGSGIIRVDFAGDVSGACPYDQGLNGGAAGTGISLYANGGNETRPTNAAVNYLIKY